MRGGRKEGGPLVCDVASGVKFDCTFSGRRRFQARKRGRKREGEGSQRQSVFGDCASLMEVGFPPHLPQNASVANA